MRIICFSKIFTRDFLQFALQVIATAGCWHRISACAIFVEWCNLMQVMYRLNFYAFSSSSAILKCNFNSSSFSVLNVRPLVYVFGRRLLILSCFKFSVTKHTHERPIAYDNWLFLNCGNAPSTEDVLVFGKSLETGSNSAHCLIFPKWVLQNYRKLAFVMVENCGLFVLFSFFVLVTVNLLFMKCSIRICGLKVLKSSHTIRCIFTRVRFCLKELKLLWKTELLSLPDWADVSSSRLILEDLTTDHPFFVFSD